MQYLRTLLELARHEIATNGYISEEVRKNIFRAFSLLDCLFANYCVNFGPPKVNPQNPPSEKNQDSPSEKDVDTDADKEDQLKKIRTKLLVLSIDQQLEKINELERYATERETLTADAEARSCSLPPADEADKFLRYEAHYDRKLYCAMDHLERLQRQRKGETVPPPLNIHLGRRN